MKAPGPADHGYVLIDRRSARAHAEHDLAAAVRSLEGQGWRQVGAVEDLTIWVGPRSRLRVTQVGRRHLLIGDWRAAREAVHQSLAAVIARSQGPTALAHAVVGQGWGRYVLAWRADDGRLGLLRDPTGALDCAWWRRDGAILAVHEPHRALDPVLPTDLAIDWDALKAISEAPELLGDRLALTGLTAVLPGTADLIGEASQTVAAWTPIDFCRLGMVWDDRPDAMVEVVDHTLEALVRPHRRLVGEISGGLDSAIASASLKTCGAAARTTFMNFHGDRPEGDERAYARAVAETLGVGLEEVQKPVEALTVAQLVPLGDSLRPSLQGVDVTYDAAVAARMRRLKATALVTGQGGDAVFFQAPDPAVAADRYQREGLSALSPTFLAEVGRWTRHSAWTVLALAVNGRRASPEADGGRRHPWLEPIADLPPAKARQLTQYVNAQLFWGDCLRARAGDLVQPFLSQPVVEHCLAIPADRLVAGVRDRGLARRAFAARLPRTIVDRRGKGDLSHFYGQITRASLPTLKPLLLEGLLARHGLVDGGALEAELAEAQLVWRTGYNRLLVAAVLEVWARSWQMRIADIRRSQISLKPVQNADMQVPEIGRTDEDMTFTAVGHQRGFPVGPIEGAEEHVGAGGIEIALDQKDGRAKGFEPIEGTVIDIGLRPGDH